jgi:membrane protease YdiL (CAAX protease family)
VSGDGEPRGPRLATPIGRALRRSPGAIALASLVALAAVAADLLALRSASPYGWPRWLAALVALAILHRIGSGDRASSGLVRRPLPSVRYWVRATGLIGAAVAAIVAIALGAMWLAGADLPVPVLEPEDALRHAPRMIVVAPILEEIVWRAIVCAPIAALAGPWAAVAASGAGFALLHVAYGNPAPDNLVAGFVLAWAFLRSGTLAVPIVLHALGNLCALLAQLAAGAWGG